jgi:hypothetical protein
LPSRTPPPAAIRDPRHLKDGSVSKEEAKSDYADLFARIGEYVSGAEAIVELVLAAGKFL